MIWLDGRGADGNGPCAFDTPAQCLDTVKFYDFSIQDLPIQNEAHSKDKDKNAALMMNQEAIDKVSDSTNDAVAGIGNSKRDKFCCFDFQNKDNVCGSCQSTARADPKSWCSTDAAACRACHEKASWCDGSDDLLLAVEVDGEEQTMIRAFRPAYIAVPVLFCSVVAIMAGWFGVRLRKRPRVQYEQLPELWRCSENLMQAPEPPAGTDQTTLAI